MTSVDTSLNKLIPVNVPLNVSALLPDDLSLWRYYGSLTTPSCNEIVHWTVFTKPMPLSRRQVRINRILLFIVNSTLPKPIVLLYSGINSWLLKTAQSTVYTITIDPLSLPSTERLYVLTTLSEKGYLNAGRSTDTLQPLTHFLTELKRILAAKPGIGKTLTMKQTMVLMAGLLIIT